MGDYTKLIVNCGVKKREDIEAFKKEIEEKLDGLCSSAYHCGGELLHIDNEWHQRTDLVIVNQFKYSRGLDEFLDWLEPMVRDGFGDEDIWAIIATEYENGVSFRKLNPTRNEEER